MAAEPSSRPRLTGTRASAVAVLAALAVLGGCRQEPQPVSAATGEPQPPVVARAAVDRAVATTGDVITYTVTIDHDPAWEVEVPEAGAEIAGFRIVDVGRVDPRPSQGRVVEERWYELRADLVGSYVLPPVEVRAWRPAEGPEAPPAEEISVATSEIFVEVESVLPEGGEATDIRDIKPLRHPASRIPWGWVAGGLVVIVLAAIAIGVVRRRRRAALPLPPPHAVAFAALDALRGTDFDDPEAVRHFYFAISHTLREYVEGRFGLNATDLTSEEILPALDRLDELSPGPEHELKRFLVDTDQVKFAKHQPDEEEIVTTYERALSFVEATRSAATQDAAVPS